MKKTTTGLKVFKEKLPFYAIHLTGVLDQKDLKACLNAMVKELIEDGVCPKKLASFYATVSRNAFVETMDALKEKEKTSKN